jgi:hypothetical protein
MDYKYQSQGQLSGQQVSIPLNIIIEPNYEESNTNGSDLDNDTTETLKINDTFKDWNAVEIAINTYAKHNGFVAIKARKDIDNIDKSIIRRRVYRC